MLQHGNSPLNAPAFQVLDAGVSQAAFPRMEHGNDNNISFLYSVLKWKGWLYINKYLYNNISLPSALLTFGDIQ